MKKNIIAIDPGAHGGIAVLDIDGEVVEVVKMPDTMADIYEFLSKYSSSMHPLEILSSPVCYLEDVGHGMPGQSSVATAKFARHCGHLEMALLALEIPTHTVTPQKWMRHYQLGKSSEYSKTEWKNRLKSKAQQLFPHLGKTLSLATSDALLIASYGLSKEKGN